MSNTKMKGTAGVKACVIQVKTDKEINMSPYIAVQVNDT